MIEERLNSALALEPAERRQIVSEFFTAHPGNGGGALGLGRAIADFLDWEIRSGRIADGGAGSPWWRLVNGGMILDLRDAATVLGHDSGRADREPGACTGNNPVSAWMAYARTSVPANVAAGRAREPGESPVGGSTSAQTRLWAAHQASLHAALVAAETVELIGGESPAERDFARLVVGVVDATAEHCRPTDTDELAHMTARHYPQEYPITPAAWAALHERFAPLLP